MFYYTICDHNGSLFRSIPMELTNVSSQENIIHQAKSNMFDDGFSSKVQYAIFSKEVSLSTETSTVYRHIDGSLELKQFEQEQSDFTII